MCVCVYLCRAVGGPLDHGDAPGSVLPERRWVLRAVNHLLSLCHPHGCHPARHGGAVRLPACPASALVRNKHIHTHTHEILHTRLYACYSMYNKCLYLWGVHRLTLMCTKPILKVRFILSEYHLNRKHTPSRQSGCHYSPLEGNTAKAALLQFYMYKRWMFFKWNIPDPKWSTKPWAGLQITSQPTAPSLLYIQYKYRYMYMYIFVY